MKVFLTGGTGFIGKPLTKNLLQRGWQVTALVRNPESPSAQQLCTMGASLSCGDVTDKETMKTGMDGADIVINNAGWYELGVTKNEARRMFEINVQGTENVLALAKELNIPRIIHVSTIGYWGPTGKMPCDETYVRQNPVLSEYERSKRDAHEIALQKQKLGEPIIIVCPSHVMGANDHSILGYFLRLYINKLLPGFAWSPNAVYSFVEVNDVAEGIALAAEKGILFETYILSGEQHTCRDMFSAWASKPGAIRPLIWFPPWLLHIPFASLEPFERMVSLSTFISRETLRGVAANWNYSSKKAQNELGWSFRPFQQAWSEIIDAELVLRKKRKKRDIVSMLKPLDN